MNNLELKIKLNNTIISNDKVTMRNLVEQLDISAKKMHIQIDTYFKTYDQSNNILKIREEKINENNSVETRTYAISYVAESVTTYEIANYDNFLKVIGPGLQTENIVEKLREVYVYKGARIHIDSVKHLGDFMKIKVVYDDIDDCDNNNNHETAQDIFDELINLLNLNEYEAIECSYRELIQLSCNSD